MKAERIFDLFDDEYENTRGATYLAMNHDGDTIISGDSGGILGDLLDIVCIYAKILLKNFYSMKRRGSVHGSNSTLIKFITGALKKVSRHTARHLAEHAIRTLAKRFRPTLHAMESYKEEILQMVRTKGGNSQSSEWQIGWCHRKDLPRNLWSLLYCVV